MAARGLERREQAEFRQILEEKLSLPHLRDLSRNPMQLTILLSLVHTKGSALPDKRTALYDAYVDLFFGRESAKNPIVRRHLELLKDVHRYLAWMLHSRAEDARRSTGDGRIATEELKETLRAYLKQENHATDIVEDLFSVLLERLVMIVSRVEGTHEFEVQPLREYFAARYLYDTASYSPPGKERPGSKPDRFDAIAKNPYWLNVLRFYCGCYSKGELLDLAESVKSIERDVPLGRTRRTEMIATMLLQDWVFTQSPKALNEITNELKSPDSLRRLSAFHYALPRGETLRLPSGKGSWNEIVLCAYNALFDEKLPPGDAVAYAQLVRDNDTSENIAKKLAEDEERLVKNIGRWITVASQLHALQYVPNSAFKKQVATTKLQLNEVAALCSAGHHDIFMGQNQNGDDAARYMLLEAYPFDGGRDDGSISFLSKLKELFAGRHVYRGSGAHSEELLKTTEEISSLTSPADTFVDSPFEQLAANCHALAVSISSQAKAIDEAQRIEKVWDVVANASVATLGISPTTLMIGLSTCEHFSIKVGRPRKCYLYDFGQPIVDRLRFFRTQSTNEEYIRSLLIDTQTNAQAQLLIACILYWSNHSIILKHQEELSRALELLSEFEWHFLCNAISLIGHLRKKTRPGKLEPGQVNSLPSERFALLLAQMIDEKSTIQLFHQHAVKLASQSISSVSFRTRLALLGMRAKLISWEDCSKILRESRAFPIYIFSPELRLSDDAVREILNEPAAFPLSVWYAAQEIAYVKGFIAVKPVALIARRDRWFSS